MNDFAGVIVLLGATNDAVGNLSSIALERCNLALLEYRLHQGYAILPTGGFGKHFNQTTRPHAHYTRRWLFDNGVPERDTLKPVYSSSTIEDALLAKPVLTEIGVCNILVITSDFHLARTKLIFENELNEFEVGFSASKTNLPEDGLDRLFEHEKNAVARLLGSSKFGSF